MRALSYFVDEALISIRRAYKTALIATGTIAAAFFVLGGFLVLTANMERVFTRWQDAAEFSVYLRDDVTPAQRGELENTLRASDLVRRVEAVSKDEAMRRFRQNFGAFAEAAAELPENPLPASIEVQLRADADSTRVDALAKESASIAGVADVRYDRRWIQRLMNAASLVRAGGFALAAVLVLAAALTVASVVRLALFARREEIHIMQLVGAPLAYIRGPFVVEGLVQGGIGAAVALAVLGMAFITLRSRAGALLAGVVEPASLVFLSAPMCAALLAGGMAVGCVGGFIAARSAREVAA